jgi:four helix bundle protein
MQDFKALQVWQRSHQLALDTYKATKGFPKDELFGLTSQLRRAVTSVPSNIAEGSGRQSNAEFARFLSIAMGSAAETEYQFLLAKDLGFLTAADFVVLSNEIVEIRRMLNSLIQRVRNAQANN